MFYEVRSNQEEKKKNIRSYDEDCWPPSPLAFIMIPDSMGYFTPSFTNNLDKCIKETQYKN